MGPTSSPLFTDMSSCLLSTCHNIPELYLKCVTFDRVGVWGRPRLRS